MAAPLSTPQSRDSMLASALVVLRRDGAAGLRVRAVAEQAGCSTTGVYTHFGSKNGLVEALFVDGFERFDAALAEVSGLPTPLAHLAAVAERYRHWAITNPTQYMVMFGGSVPEFTPGDSARHRALRSFIDLTGWVHAAMTSGELVDDDPASVAYHLWATIHGYVMLELASMNPTAHRANAAIYGAGLDRLINGLRIAAPPNP